MEEQCNFTWELIEQNPALRQRIFELETSEFSNYDKQIKEIVDLFREIEEIMDYLKEVVLF